MKMLLVSMLILAACSSGSSPAEAHQDSNDLVGHRVTVVMESGNGLAVGILIRLDNKGVLIRRDDGKLYFYPDHRLFVIAEQ